MFAFSAKMGGNGGEMYFDGLCYNLFVCQLACIVFSQLSLDWTHLWTAMISSKYYDIMSCHLERFVCVEVVCGNARDLSVEAAFVFTLPRTSDVGSRSRMS